MNPIRVACFAFLAVAPWSVSAAGQSTSLPFDGVGIPTLNVGYADRVTGPNTGGFPYSGSGAFTPNVIAAFGATNQGHAVSAYTYATGYNSLINVIYAPVTGLVGAGDELVITLTADPGFVARISSFDVGNWGVAIDVPYVRVFDQNGALHFEELNVALNANVSPNARHFALSPIPEGEVLSLRIGLDGLIGYADNVGLDNFTFGQRAVAPATIGASFCGPAASNSSGAGSAIRAWGSASVAQNDVRLLAAGLGLNTFGFFLASRTQGLVAHPGGSFGTLCLGGAIGRYVGPGQIQNTGPVGNFSLVLDLARIPSPNGPVGAQPGETWRFQAWHRDLAPNGAPGSNFTDALVIPFS